MPREQPDLEVQVPAACLCPVLRHLSSVAPTPTPPTIATCPRGGGQPNCKGLGCGARVDTTATQRLPEAEVEGSEIRALQSIGWSREGAAERGRTVGSSRFSQSAMPGCFLRPGPWDLREPTVNPSSQRAVSSPVLLLASDTSVLHCQQWSESANTVRGIGEFGSQLFLVGGLIRRD